MKMPQTRSRSAMIIACPACESRFTVDPDRLGPEGRTVKCSRCGYRWRVDATGRPASQPDPAAEAVEQELPPGPSAREVLARHAEAAASAEPPPVPAEEEPSPATDIQDGSAALTEDPGSAGAGTEPSDGTEATPTGTAAAGPAAAAQAPGRPDLAQLTPRQRQKLRDAQNRKSRLRVVLLFLLVLVSVAALVGLMKKGPQIERALQGEAQPVAPVPAEPAPAGQAGGQ